MQHGRSQLDYEGLPQHGAHHEHHDGLPLVLHHLQEDGVRQGGSQGPREHGAARVDGGKDGGGGRGELNKTSGGEMGELSETIRENVSDDESSTVVPNETGVVLMLVSKDQAQNATSADGQKQPGTGPTSTEGQQQPNTSPLSRKNKQQQGPSPQSTEGKQKSGPSLLSGKNKQQSGPSPLSTEGTQQPGPGPPSLEGTGPSSKSGKGKQQSGPNLQSMEGKQQSCQCPLSAEDREQPSPGLIILPCDSPQWSSIVQLLRQLEVPSHPKSVTSIMRQLHRYTGEVVDGPANSTEDLADGPANYGNIQHFLEVECGEDERDLILLSILPSIASLALDLPHCKPFLGVSCSPPGTGDYRSYHPAFTSSLLAHAFLSLLPSPALNLHIHLWDPGMDETHWKLRRFFSYIHDLAQGHPGSVASYSREVGAPGDMDLQEHWTTSTAPLIPLEVREDSGLCGACTRLVEVPRLAHGLTAAATPLNGHAALKHPQCLVPFLYMDGLAQGESVRVHAAGGGNESVSINLVESPRLEEGVLPAQSLVEALNSFYVGVRPGRAARDTRVSVMRRPSVAAVTSYESDSPSPDSSPMSLSLSDSCAHHQNSDSQLSYSLSLDIPKKLIPLDIPTSSNPLTMDTPKTANHLSMDMPKNTNPPTMNIPQNANPLSMDHPKNAKCRQTRPPPPPKPKGKKRESFADRLKAALDRGNTPDSDDQGAGRRSADSRRGADTRKSADTADTRGGANPADPANRYTFGIQTTVVNTRKPVVKRRNSIGFPTLAQESSDDFFTATEDEMSVEKEPRRQPMLLMRRRMAKEMSRAMSSEAELSIDIPTPSSPMSSLRSSLASSLAAPSTSTSSLFSDSDSFSSGGLGMPQLKDTAMEDLAEKLEACLELEQGGLGFRDMELERAVKFLPTRSLSDTYINSIEELDLLSFTQSVRMPRMKTQIELLKHKPRRSFSSVDLLSSTSLHSTVDPHFNPSLTCNQDLHSSHTNVPTNESTVSQHDLTEPNLHFNDTNRLHSPISHNSTDPNIPPTISSNSTHSTTPLNLLDSAPPPASCSPHPWPDCLPVSASAPSLDPCPHLCLQVLLLWVASSVSGRPCLLYNTHSHPQLTHLAKVICHLRTRQLTAGQLTQLILKLKDSKDENIFDDIVRLC